jgi:glycosyltransferase involved in cell wall biosynthesis
VTSGLAAPTTIDVVITNHDYARFLGAAIDSVLGQEGPPARVIVVDDGSTDSSRAVIESYGDAVSALFREQAGQAAAFNVGFAAGTGELVVFLDADDVLLPGALRRVRAAFAGGGVAKAHYRLAVIDADGTPTGEIKPPKHVALPRGDLRRHALAFPLDVVWLATSGNAFSRSALERLFPLPTRLGNAGADWYVVQGAALFGRVAAIDEPLALYRVHGANAHAVAATTTRLDYLRRTIAYAAEAHRFLAEVAEREGLRLPADGPASVSDLGNRLVSLVLDPAHHPVAGDTRIGLVRAGLRATRRRFDVHWPMKAVYVAWFLATAITPKPLSRHLADLFLLPERRPGASALLARLQADRAADVPGP